MIKYSATVTAIGPLTGEFVEAGILVLFGASAPEELRDFALIHDGEELAAPLGAGDAVWVDANCYRVLAVGDVANENLKNLGHLVLKFNGQTEPELPGDVCVELQPLPPVTVGTVLRIEGDERPA